MKNFVKEGETLTLTAPYALSSGDGFQVGAKLFAVATAAAANGATVEGATKGVFDLTCLSTDVIAIGALIYWDNTNKRCTSTSTSNLLMGKCVELAKANGDTTVRVRLLDTSV